MHTRISKFKHDQTQNYLMHTRILKFKHDQTQNY